MVVSIVRAACGSVRPVAVDAEPAARRGLHVKTQNEKKTSQTNGRPPMAGSFTAGTEAPGPLAAQLLCLADCFDGATTIIALRNEAKVLATATQLAAPALSKPVSSSNHRTAAERGVRALRSSMRSLRAWDLSRTLTRWVTAVREVVAAEREAALVLALKRHADGRKRLDATWRARLAEATNDGRTYSPFERIENQTLVLELCALEAEVPSVAAPPPPHRAALASHVFKLHWGRPILPRVFTSPLRHVGPGSRPRRSIQLKPHAADRRSHTPLMPAPPPSAVA